MVSPSIGQIAVRVAVGRPLLVGVHMQVRLLGPVDVLADEGPRAVSGRLRKAVLALLALRPGDLVSVDRMIDVLWGESAPGGARNTVQAHVSYLRRVLGDRFAIRSHQPGYRLLLGPEGTDVQTAGRLIAQAREELDPAGRAASAQAALALWRGRPLADISGLPWLAEQADLLQGLRRQAVQILIEAQLELGEHARILPGLERLAREYPFDEQIHVQLMLALYRSGRQADALGVFTRMRRLLRDDLGLAPSRALRDLSTAILRQDPELERAGR